MRLPTSRTRHRLELAAAILVTVGAVYGLSRIIEAQRVKSAPLPAMTYVPVAPPIIPRMDPPLAPVQAASKVSPALLAAVGEGDVATLEKLYTKGMPLDGTLQRAAETGNVAVVRWLLDHEADVTENANEADAPILAADPHPEVVKLLLARGAVEPDLSVACIAGAPNAVSRLLAKHVSPNPKDGSTPLYDAIASTLATPENKRAIVEKLLAAGADPNAGEGSSTPMAAAVATCEAAEEKATGAPPACLPLIRALAARGARVGAEALETAIGLAEPARGPVLDAVLGGRLDPGATAAALAQASGERDGATVRKLAARGVAWSWHDGEPDAAAPLIDAIERLDVPLVRAMLDAGAPVDQRLKDGRSTLGVALEKVATDAGDGARIVELLLARGAGVNRRLPDGRTALFAAAEVGDVRVIDALLDHGARVNDTVLDETALDAAERTGHLPAARVLHARGGRRAENVDD